MQEQQGHKSPITPDSSASEQSGDDPTTLDIAFTLSSNLSPSVWNFDPVFIYAGENARIVGSWVTGSLYRVRNAAGKEKAISRLDLIKCGIKCSTQEGQEQWKRI